MLHGAIFGHLYHLAAHFDGTQRLARVIAQQRHFGIEPHIFLFAKAAHGIDHHIGAIEVAPYDSCLWLAVRHDGGQSRNTRTIEQIKVRFWAFNHHIRLCLHFMDSTPSDTVMKAMFRL